MEQPASNDHAATNPSAAQATFRDMSTADVDLITALDRRLFPTDYWPRQMFVEEMSQPKTRRYIIAELGGQVVGYAGMMCIAPTADIQTIGVLPECEGRGIARAMMAILLDESLRRGAEEVMLEVSAKNPRAQDLYLRYGFEQIHTRKRYYRDGADALVMRLQLNAPAGSAKDGAKDSAKEHANKNKIKTKNKDNG